MTPDELARRIRTAREEKHWTQEDLGRQVGVTSRTVINWEARGRPPMNRIGALEKVLGVKLRDGDYDGVVEIPVPDLGDGSIIVTIPVHGELTPEQRRVAEASARAAAEAALRVFQAREDDTDGR